MSAETVQSILAPFLVGLSVAFVWPQVVRSFRSVEGLSLASMAQNVWASGLWVLYGVRTTTPPLVFANATAGIGFALVLVAAARAEVLPARTLLFHVGGLLVLVPIALTIPATALGWAAIAVGATGILPQVARTLTATDHAGVSRPTYAMVVALTTGWSVYGILEPDLLIVLPNVVILPSALLVLWQTRPRRSGRTAHAKLN